MNVEPGPRVTARLGDESADEAFPALEKGPHSPCSPEGVVHGEPAYPRGIQNKELCTTQLVLVCGTNNEV